MSDSSSEAVRNGKKKLVNFRLDSRDIERLRCRAKANERTVSGELRKLIREALDTDSSQPRGTRCIRDLDQVDGPDRR